MLDVCKGELLHLDEYIMTEVGGEVYRCLYREVSSEDAHEHHKERRADHGSADKDYIAGALAGCAGGLTDARVDEDGHQLGKDDFAEDLDYHKEGAEDEVAKVRADIFAVGFHKTLPF